MLKSHTIYKTLLLCGCLLSLAPLTACGQKEPSATSTNTSQSSTVQTTSSQQDQDKSQTSSATSEANQSVEAASEQGEQEITETVTNSSGSEIVTALDVNGLSAGDYSSIVGTWANAKGEVITVAADGEMTGQRGDGSEPFTLHIRVTGISELGYAYGGVGSFHGEAFWSHATIAIVPAGTANILGDVGVRDHIEIGHGTHAANPEEQFFRQ